MSVINMAKNIKQVHPDFVICYKVGAFYNCYGKDAYIISFLFRYRIKTVEKNVPITGFSRNAISRVSAKLEKEKINYILIDTKNNYDVDAQEDFKNLNKYKEVLEKSKKIVNIRLRIEKIKEKLLEEQDIEKVRKIEDIINEK